MVLFCSQGKDAHRVWTAIYSQACFSGESDPGEAECEEKRVFYRLISGLHSSITAHIAKQYLVGKNTENLMILSTRGHVVDRCHSRNCSSSCLACSISYVFIIKNEVGCISKAHVWFFSGPLDEEKDVWGPNLDLFESRLGRPELKSRVENLYFAFSFVLRCG